MLVALVAAAKTHDGYGLAEPAVQVTSNTANALPDDQIPLTYDPEALSIYFKRRPMQVRSVFVIADLDKVLLTIGQLGNQAFPDCM
jgi:hypothetical protein